ncbi:hypothetical protein [Streptomyces sp. NBC_00038]|nr:hypothetical protein [Streptomyces sp. NBC_00038]MCX5558589.1 hypothetical protein [Streptomyces sp. NBC_00038]
MLEIGSIAGSTRPNRNGGYVAKPQMAQPGTGTTRIVDDRSST